MRPIRLAFLVVPALLAALLLAPSTRAQPPVEFIDDPPTYLSAGSFPASVAVGDFNDDGDPDLAVANQFSDDVSVLLGDAGGGFTAAASVPPRRLPSGQLHRPENHRGHLRRAGPGTQRPVPCIGAPAWGSCDPFEGLLGYRPATTRAQGQVERLSSCPAPAEDGYNTQLHHAEEPGYA